MRTGSLAFLAGVILLHQLAGLPALAWCLLLVLLFPLSFYCRSSWRLILLTGVGFLWALLQAHGIMNHSLAGRLVGSDIRLTGTIVDLPQSDELRTAFTLKLSEARDADGPISLQGKIKLSWYGKRRPVLKGGEVWQLWCRLKPVHGYLNPGGLDMEAVYYQQGIRVRGYVRDKPGTREENLRLTQQETLSLAAMRQSLLDKLELPIKNTAYQGVVEALVLGERQAITREQWRVFQLTGTNHLVAISGLHIGLVAGLVFWLVKMGWGWSGRLLEWIPAQRLAAVCALLAAITYAALAGFSIPTQRALIMLVVVMVALWRYHVIRPSSVLAAALWAVLLYDSSSILSAGFWLSFAAVSVIGFVMAGRYRMAKWRSAWRIQWMIGVGLFPLTLFLFQQASIIAPLANLVAVPVISLLVVPLCLLASLMIVLAVPGGETLLMLAEQVLDLLWPLLTWLSSQSLSAWQQASPSPLILCYALAGIAVLLAPPRWPARWMGLILLLPLLFTEPQRPAQGQLRFSLLDVGQGLAVVVETAGHVLVYDTGPGFGEFDTGIAVVVPFLRQQGWRKVDTLMISHDDNDHRGGAQSLRQMLPVTQVLASQPTGQESACQLGQQWEWDGVIFTVLHPTRERQSGRRNDDSCVLQVEAGGQKLLLTGDIEKPTESELVAKWREQLQSDVLVLAHHGSNTSSTQRFLREVQPRWALIPAGYLNRYRFPHPKVLERLAEDNIPWMSTADSGTISLLLPDENNSLIPESFRSRQRRFWHTP